MGGMLTLMILFVIGTYWVVNRFFNRRYAVISAGILSAIYIILLIGWGV